MDTKLSKDKLEFLILAHNDTMGKPGQVSLAEFIYQNTYGIDEQISVIEKQIEATKARHKKELDVLDKQIRNLQSSRVAKYD